MARFTHSLQAWGSARFAEVLKREVEALRVDELPLQQGLAQGSQVLDDARTAMIISFSETDTSICAKVGIFFHGILAGCSCADDPTPVDTLNEYCEVLLTIDKANAETTAMLIPSD